MKAKLAMVIAAITVLTSCAVAQNAAPDKGTPAGMAPAVPGSYCGVYMDGTPASYKPVERLAKAMGRTPRIVLYFSGWHEPFAAGFAGKARRRGAVPLVQINPYHADLASVARGSYDRYLVSYADAVRAFHGPVILSFGHEMNGDWYPWGNRHAKPHVFVAAWRHIVSLFRQQGADKVTWLWTINAFGRDDSRVANPSPWWPGASYVSWVGIDGYYYQPSQQFRTLFGPSITAARKLTQDPILIAETAASPRAGKAAKITDLLSGVSENRLLGFVWFDQKAKEDWQLDDSPTALAAFRAATGKLQQQ